MIRRLPPYFKDLLASLKDAGLLEAAAGDTDIQISHLAHDSRDVRPDTCFVAVPGFQVDGHLFIDKAVYHGATAVIAERPLEEAIPDLRAFAQVSNARAALAEVAAAFFNHPTRNGLNVVGITGTNGKSTIASVLYHAFTHIYGSAGLIGTIETRVGERVLPSAQTTPDPVRLQRLFAEMLDEDIRHAAMEVSSHALDQHRVGATRFSVGVFTNLTHEHLDYHETFEKYAEAKALLFRQSDAAVINADDSAGGTMLEAASGDILTFGTSAKADIRFRIIENALSGLVMEIDGHRKSFRLAGRFNASNLAAAYGVLRINGFGAEEALDALAEAPPVAGRLEVLPESIHGTTVIVDYAHTPDALENILQTVSEMKPESGQVTLVFGCGGDRDAAKRPVMGRIAENLADRVVVTSDNPRTEDPDTIIDDILVGMERTPFLIEPDRRSAINAAVREAGNEDVIVIVGKGHETYQIVGREHLEFDDVDVARNALQSRLTTKPS